MWLVKVPSLVGFYFCFFNPAVISSIINDQNWIRCDRPLSVICDRGTLNLVLQGRKCPHLEGRDTTCDRKTRYNTDHVNIGKQSINFSKNVLKKPEIKMVWSCMSAMFEATTTKLGELDIQMPMNVKCKNIFDRACNMPSSLCTVRYVTSHSLRTRNGTYVLN